MTTRAPGSGVWRVLSLIAAIGTLLIAAPADAQEQHRVRGEVVDSAGRPVQNAMVVALNRADSVLVQFAITEGDGGFLIQDLGAGEYILQVTSFGYGTVRRDFEVAAEDVNAGRVIMAIVAAELDPLIVNVEQVPFVNRRDTLDYNAAAFQLRANASVEDLLASLPGVRVEDDGTIVAQGEEVTQILVDGREFFGGNTTIATRNLPADAIERVQIYDQKSDMAEFTGIEDGEEQRTLNLQLREDARRGSFGTATGALGGEQGGAPPVGPETNAQLRYQQSAALNRFSPNLQLALLGGTNNINQSPVAFGGGRSGRNGGGGNGGDGVTDATAIGGNVGYDPGNDRWIRGSYFFNGADNVEDQSLQREQLLGQDLSQSLDQLTSSQSDTRNHRLNLNAQYQFSEGHDFRFRGNFTAGSTDRIRIQNQTTLLPGGGLVNSAFTDLNSGSDNVGGDAQLTWRKRLGDSGRSLVFEARGSLNDRESSSDLRTEIGTPDVGDVITYNELMQLQTQDNRTFSESQRIALTQPLDDSRRKVLELYAERRSVNEDQVQSVFDVASGSPVFAPSLSSDLDQGYDYLNGGFRLSRNTESTFLTVGAEYQRSSLDGRVLDRDQRIERDFDFLLPSAVFRWEIKEGWTLEGNYRASAREPNARELQPFVDNTDPLNIYVGNPELDPEFQHSISLNQRYFDQFSFRSIGTYARFAYTTDAVQQARSIDGQGVQTVTPVNTDDGWTLNSGIDFSTPLRSIGAEIELGYDLTWSRQQQLLNLEDNRTSIVRNGVSLSLENRRKTTFDLEGGVTFNFNDVSYSLNERQNQSYVNTTLNARSEWYPSDAWTIGSSVSHRIFDEEVFGPGQNVTLWQGTLSRFFMDQKGELQFVAFDLLDQNQGVAFVNSANFVQESRTNTLGRHFMLRVVYRIGSSFGGRGADGGGGGGARPRR